MIQDNRARWYAATASLRAADPGGFLCRYEAGRKVQARIVAADLTRERLLSLGRKPSKVVEFRKRGRG